MMEHRRLARQWMLFLGMINQVRAAISQSSDLNSSLSQPLVSFALRHSTKLAMSIQLLLLNRDPQIASQS